MLTSCRSHHSLKFAYFQDRMALALNHLQYLILSEVLPNFEVVGADSHRCRHQPFHIQWQAHRSTAWERRLHFSVGLFSYDGTRH